ncbi:AraC family transcriptional regulator [Acinetobacter sp. 10FS3-1]|uniref:AraC family transcriptional regulator n=1 Tax=Acinetobacter sp. 10FS3-1 TaxID=2563897 RepID=UPI00157CEFBE|nr:AraC family transcriptional regulator [Acinetobacter sp. 10FS3-1]QKQ69424.1 AraC family transcriptional regulator [Acinetobacter sp. 10FS3-1]
MHSLSQQDIELKHYSKKADFAQDLMSTICGEHRLDTSYRNTLDFHYDGMRLPSKRMTIGTISYGANVAINTSHLRAYSISLPLCGKQILNMRGEQYYSDEKTGLIISNAQLQDLTIDKNCKKLQVVIPERSLHLVLADILKQPVEKSVIFSPRMHFDSQQLTTLWWKNIQDFLNSKSQYINSHGLSLLAEDYENFIIKTLLLFQENNYSEQLRQVSNQQQPAYIQKVHKFIITHACEEISVDTLQQLAGVSKSKLYEEFQTYYGTSPLAYLKKYRLQQIYKSLCTPSVDKRISISQLAFKWGFNHLSRFSQDYREEFGEKPSDTKNKFKELH